VSSRARPRDIGHVSHITIDKIIPEWERAKQNLSPSPLGLGCDGHRLVNQWGLPWHPDTLTSMTNLDHAWKSQGRDEEAMALMKQVETLQNEVLGIGHPTQ